MFIQMTVECFGVKKLLQLCNLPLRIEPDQIDPFMEERLSCKETTPIVSPRVKSIYQPLAKLNHEYDSQRH